jgi:Tol biopolymer transport system component
MGEMKTFPIVPAARWKRIEDVFLGALAVDAGERERFVMNACGDDAGLRAEVAALLANAEDAPSYVGDIVASSIGAFADGTSPLVDRQLGPYRLLSLIGEGGMGAVYLAERSDAEFRRHVAIKVLREGLASRDAIARFRDERQILADLDHPGIVRLIDGGTSDGMPYLVMEKVDGVSITHHAERLSIRERIALVRPACAALAYAHGRNVVHRDIKPSNILVTSDGAVKLVDFGIAKLLDATEREARTKTGAALLTPEYASPEQACGDPVTPATDVYSLGAVIYDLLTGRPPVQLRGGPLAIVKAICEEEPPLPSTVAPGITRELDHIVMKAMSKEPAHRYASIEDLDRDLERFLDDRPISASPPSWLRFARRRAVKWKFGLAALVLAAGVATVAIFRTHDAVTAPRDMQRLTQQLGTISAARFAHDGSIYYAARWGGGPRSIYRMTLDEPAREVVRDADLLAISPRGDLATLRDVKLAGVGAGFAMTRTGRLVRTDAQGQTQRELATDVISADWSGDELAITRFIPGRSTNGNGSRGVVEWPIGSVVYEMPNTDLAFVRVSPDGTRIAVLEGGALRRQIVVIDRAKHVTKVGTMHDISGLAWSDDGELLVADATNQGDRCVHAVALDGTRRLVQCSTGTLTLLDIDRSGRVLVSSTRGDGRILLKAPGSTEEREVQSQTTDVLYDVTPDGKRIVFGTGSLDGPLYVRDVDGPPKRIGTGRGVAISPDGAWVASDDLAHHHHLTPTGPGREIEQMPPPGVKMVLGFLGGWSPDGKVLYSGCVISEKEHATCTFTPDGRSALVIRGKRPASSVRMRSISPDGRWILANDNQHPLELVAVDGSSAHPLPDTSGTRNLGHEGFGDVVGWSADGKSVFVIGTGRPSKRLDVDLLNLETGEETPWKTLGPEDAGIIDYTGIIVFAGGEGYAYSYTRQLSDLYLIK